MVGAQEDGTRGSGDRFNQPLKLFLAEALLRAGAVAAAHLRFNEGIEQDEIGVRRVHHRDEPTGHPRRLVIAGEVLEELGADVVVAHRARHLNARVHERLERLGGNRVVLSLAERERDVAQAEHVRRRMRQREDLAYERLRGGGLVRIVAHRLVFLPREGQAHVDVRDEADRLRVERPRRRSPAPRRRASRACGGKSRRHAEKAPPCHRFLLAHGGVSLSRWTESARRRRTGRGGAPSRRA